MPFAFASIFYHIVQSTSCLYLYLYQNMMNYLFVAFGLLLSKKEREKARVGKCARKEA
jgi:hypothetical protein